jgi:L-lysine exporter family protein LysE/ArgO
VLAAILAGAGSGASLIIAIGAQNAFVLRQGIRREHVFAICLLCSLSDVLLVTLGILGLGYIVELAPITLEIIRWVGVAFLTVYACFAIKRAIRPSALVAADATVPGLSLAAAVAQAAAFTYLNPHVYLDTVLLLGSLANSQGPTLRWAFMAGAMASSFGWFFGLGYGARFLAPIFAKPTAWRVLDTVIAVVMLALALNLVLSPITLPGG